MRQVFSVLAAVLISGLAAYTVHTAETAKGSPNSGLRAQTTSDFSVQASASVRENPARITLRWPQDSCAAPQSYTVFRKAPGANAWGKGVTLPGSAIEYTDRNVSPGVPYEYQIVRNAPQFTGYGYVSAGIKVPLIEKRGRLLLVVDNTYAPELENELFRLRQDLIGDGWSVTRLDVARTDSVVNVKTRIKAQYQADPANVKAVFLFGHVPVAYSGDIAPDGHVPDHQGAWPCDGFYGDMEGVWSDRSVNDTRAAEDRNRNTPGDGKFDQSTFPASLKLMVGRVDLAKMPGRLSFGGSPTFPGEVELLRNYLNKDHHFRHKQFELPRRGFVGDYFGVRDGEAFAASGWRNLSCFFEAGNITTLKQQGTWLSTLSSNSCLWAYGCGPGSFTSIGGLGNSDGYHDGVTTELYNSDPKFVFTMLYGSWLGDWDSEDNFQRAVLALPSYGLACACSGRPHWYLHHMAMGEPIGFSALLTQNNRGDGLYHNFQNNCASQIHIALMGDPTLRMHVVAPPSNLTRTEDGNGVGLNWNASHDSVLGYHIYRAASPDGPFTRVNRQLVAGTSYRDLGARTMQHPVYMIRAVKLESSASGTYYNASQGAFAAPGELAAVPIPPASNIEKTPSSRSGASGAEVNPPTPTGAGTNTVRALSRTGGENQ